MVREMTEVNRDLAHQVVELRRESEMKVTVLRRIEAHLEDASKRAEERAHSHSAIYLAAASAVKMPSVQLLMLAGALWVAKMLGVIELLPNGGSP
jgi:hypothetical protein